MAGFLYICFDVILPKQSTFGFRGNDNRGAALAQRVLIYPLLGAQEPDSDEPGLCVHLSREDCE
jgi:hypothetical protein